MEEKLKLIRDWCVSDELSGVILTKIENIFYLTEFWGSFAFMVITEDGAFLLTDGRYAGKVKNLSLPDGIEFVLFNAENIKDFGVKFTKKLGLEGSSSLKQKTQFEKWFPSAELETFSNNIDQIRRVKSSAEISCINAAQSFVDTLLIDFLSENLRAGISEKELCFYLETQLRDKGKKGLSFDAIVAFGENSSIPHHEPGGRTLKSGDNILIDCGVTHQRYCSDVTRNYVFGAPQQAYVQDYFDLLDIQKQLLSLYKAGKKIANVDQFCRDLMKDKSAFYTHSLGHGVGLEIHEMPGISTRNLDDTFLLNEVVTCEPGWYFPERYGIRIEDLVVIGEEESLVLSEITKDLLSFSETGEVKKISR